ncbi:Mitochondrial N(5)-glutamine methyltransferase MTQ1 [Zancudomyces culisetae]|uniref:Mitochondrial N(5)-glutamine methyltransferase MTQ1 n=1 Tax=Zancudomyces culisetae TaxID=1213189 RepID=A0A1R1PIZ4_ZANCU|nr:Mitochondrial N(5)-glutamine methyltransferase MTQ1 [Zancudomyces culisetae]|eukprot:OMH80951.1 Mitochondrial N(5)-glutamine methyltransferase MTQ1 [Zancudomyces culisetae]
MRIPHKKLIQYNLSRLSEYENYGRKHAKSIYRWLREFFDESHSGHNAFEPSGSLHTKPVNSKPKAHNTTPSVYSYKAIYSRQRSWLDFFTTSVNKIVEHNYPLQYILKDHPFNELTLRVKRPILIPRPETEEWSTRLALLIRSKLISPSTSPPIEKKQESQPELQLQNRKHKRELKILDLCTGTGCIALNLAKTISSSSSSFFSSLLSHPVSTRPFDYKCSVVGLDLNPAAVNLATYNKRLNNIENAKFYQFNVFNLYKLSKRTDFDIVVSNPPYVPSYEYDGTGSDEYVTDSVKKFEDRHALVPNLSCSNSVRPYKLSSNENHNNARAGYVDSLGIEIHLAIIDFVYTQNTKFTTGLPKVVLEVSCSSYYELSTNNSLHAKHSITEKSHSPISYTTAGGSVCPEVTQQSNALFEMYKNLTLNDIRYHDASANSNTTANTIKKGGVLSQAQLLANIIKYKYNRPSVEIWLDCFGKERVVLGY